MRRSLGLILIALGAFFLTLAPLVRFYVADKFVLAPLDRYQQTKLEAPNASYFDTAAFKVVTGATLVAANTLRGDVRANNGDDRVAVWDSSTEITDRATGKQVDMQGYRIAFDRRTSELVNCCGSQVDGDTSVAMSGYGLLLPVANVQKRSYPVFDMTTRRTLPMRFGGEETVHGVATYRFVQEIPLAKTAAVDYKVPGEMLGLGKKTPSQKVDRYFSATITEWVDPRTGIPVKHRQNIKSTVQTADGKGRLTVAAADLVTVDADQKRLAEMSGDEALKIAMVRTVVPLGSVLLGLSLLLIGAMVALSAGEPSGPPAPPTAPRRSDGKFGNAAPAAGPPPAGRASRAPRTS
ncbi:MULTISPECIES: DUF3068 domain-containing protein [Thermomonosporaceae]|uniref:DUF3068 domain-containing protein n=1 Tax=Thermomonosporaceae TaxID=2012 RepID=UPI00255A97B7|nr:MULTISPECIES: DUF3068 domain-containing protein [Thermomonosporaceae]MDL4775961.1 DUF3068 domain-containing protein [Actinomadura xylanilytica]